MDQTGAREKRMRVERGFARDHSDPSKGVEPVCCHGLHRQDLGPTGGTGLWLSLARHVIANYGLQAESPEFHNKHNPL